LVLSFWLEASKLKKSKELNTFVSFRRPKRNKLNVLTIV